MATGSNVYDIKLRKIDIAWELAQAMNKKTMFPGPDFDGAGEGVEDPSLDEFEANFRRAWEIVDTTIPTIL